jgi:phosphatidylcholine synthase
LMPDEPGARETRRGRLAILPAFCVHIFTASGAALGLLALVAAVEHDWPLMFGLLGIALVVDGVDGTLARQLRVAERLPRWSGDRLDLVVDFVTYVFVPAYALAAGALLPPLLATPGAILIVATGALYFADRRMKTADNYFRGFPALWNTVAFYLFLLRPEPWIAALVIALLAVATFLPIPFVHPFRVGRLRGVNVALLAAWSVLALVAVLRGMMPGPWISGGLCAVGLYFLGAGLLRRADKV